MTDLTHRSLREKAMNKDKFKALVLYVCAKFIDRPSKLGKTKLNKVLFYADAHSQMKRREPITGETYLKNKFGPVSMHLDEILGELQREGALAVSQATAFASASRPQTLFMALKEPDLKMFNGEEIAIVDLYIDRIVNKRTASQISHDSHTLAWELAGFGEELPLFTAYAHSLRKPGARDVEWALGVLAKD
jgi:hypothetical protein